MKLALLSDTHGMLRPEIFPHLEGVDHIIHAGDVGPVEILIELEAVAPVTAVWGNTDGFEIRHRIPEVAHKHWNGREVVVLHGHQLGSPTPEALALMHPKVDMIVFGHTHLPLIRQVGSVLTVNPGSCGPPRFKIAPTLAIATLGPDRIGTELLEL